MDIPIDLDKPRTLRFTRRSMVAAEDHFKIGFARAVINPGVKFTWMMLYAGLLGDDSTMTPEKAGELFDEYQKAGNSLIELDEKIMDGLELGGWIRRTRSQERKEQTPTGE